MKTAKKALIGLLLSLSTIVAQEDSSIEISNSGDISVDQQTGLLMIEGNVEIHQSPFHLYSDKVTWDQNSNQLLSLGNVKVVLGLKEEGAEKYKSLASELSEYEASDFYQILTTDKLRFDTESHKLQPNGIAEIQFGIARIIGNDFSLDIKEDSIETGNYRVGMENLFLEGTKLQAKGSSLLAQNANFFIGEPDKFSIQGRAKEVIKESDTSIILKGVTLKLGPVPFFYLPYYQHDLKRRVFTLTGSAGYSGDLGGFMELRPTYSPKDGQKYYSDINFYTARGVMAGPGFLLDLETEAGNRIRTNLESGYIHDNGNLGVDIIDNPINADRHFLDFNYVQQLPNSLQLLGKVQRWSDSEIIRDFNSGHFTEIQQPETFFELNWVKRNFAFELLTQIRHEDFEYATERLPEARVQLLPSSVSGTNFYHSALLEGSMLRNDDPNRASAAEHSRFKAFYELLYPIQINKWLDLTPQATFHSLAFRDIKGQENTFNNHHVEIGFDLNAQAFGEWKIENKIWDIYGLRHFMTPTVQYRSVSEIGNNNEFLTSPIDQEIFRTGLDDIDLTAQTHLDDLDAYSMLRIGVSNRLVAKRSNGTAREILKLDLFHDSYLPNSEWEEDQNMFAANLKFKPAYWLRLDFQSRFDSDDLSLKDLFGRLQLIDGDIWDVDLSSQYLQNRLQQYVVDFRYKMTENIRFVSSVGYDARNARMYEQTYGFQIGVANYWDLFVSVRNRQGSLRNNETKFEIKVLPARF